MQGVAIDHANGFGRSEICANLHRFFEVDRYYVARPTIAALVKEGKMTGKRE